LQTQSKVASSLLVLLTQEVQSLWDVQLIHGNTHVPQAAVLFSKNVSLQVQSGAFSLLAGQEVQLDEVPEHSAH